MHLRLFGILLLLCCLAPASQAEELQGTLIEQSHEMSLPDVIQNTWKQVVAASERGDLKTVNTLVIELQKLKLQADVAALDSYAMYMIERGNEALREEDRETAAFYARKTLQLSPNSPVVLAKSLPLVRQTNTSSTGTQLGTIFREVWHHPNVALRVLKNIIYPALLAFTLGLLAATVLLFAFKIEHVLRGVARALPASIRGLLAPVIILFALVIPLLLGPLWALALWAFLIYFFMPQHRWLGFAAGTLLMLWGTVIPIRESLKGWLEHPGVQAMLDVASGVFSNSDRSRLEALAVERSNDGAVFYTLGQVLRRHGDYRQADEAFLRAEMLLGKQSWTIAERAAVAYLDGKLEKSDQLYQKAANAGQKGAAFWFNYSKAKFELMDTAKAQEFLNRAVQQNKDLTHSLEEREQLLGAQSRLAIAEIQLPFRFVLDSALHPTASIKRNCLLLARSLMPGSSPPQIAITGAVLLLFFFFARKRKTRTLPLSSYANLLPARLLKRLLVIVPGGAWIRAERPLWCFGILSFCALLLMPLLEWPVEAHFIVDAFPDFIPYYVCAVTLFGLCACYVGMHIEEA